MRGQHSDVKTWVCAIGEVVSGFFFFTHPEERDVNECPGYRAGGQCLRSQLARRRQESSGEW